MAAQRGGVDTQAQDYQDNFAKWTRINDFLAGGDTVKNAGTKYLQALTKQSTDEYNSYKERAIFFNATRRTRDGLTGLIFRKQPQIEASEGMATLLDDVDLGGQTFEEMARDVTAEVLGVGRVGVLVDSPEGAEGATQADAERMSLRPWLSIYKSLSIINWRYERIANVNKLAFVVLEETVDILKTEFLAETKTQWRVLDLATGVYRVRVFEKDKDGNDIVISVVFPTQGQNHMDYIPFYIFGDLSPSLLELVNLNLGHYRVAADRGHASHHTALPTPWIAGLHLEEGETVEMGSTTALVLENPDAKVGYLDYDGAGLTPLREYQHDIEAEMVILGARMLEQSKRAAEAAETVAHNRAGEVSVLASIADDISAGLVVVLQWFSEASGFSEDINVRLNTDFMPMKMEAQKLTALVAALMQGAISSRTFFDNLQQGELIPEDVSFEEEQASINEAPPMLLTGDGDAVI